MVQLVFSVPKPEFALLCQEPKLVSIFLAISVILAVRISNGSPSKGSSKATDKLVQVLAFNVLTIQTQRLTFHLRKILKDFYCVKQNVVKHCHVVIFVMVHVMNVIGMY
jgi:hypothetical protein